MRRLRLTLVPLAIATCLLASAANAATLSLEPGALAGPGPFSVDLFARGLGDGAAPSVGGFDVTLSFDDSVLSFQSVTFGTTFGTTFVSDTPGAGTIQAALLSLAAPATLDAAQGPDVLLASFSFARIGNGASAIDIAGELVSDGFGKAITFDAKTSAAVAAAIPEPSAALAFAFGAALIFGGPKTRRLSPRS